jgi:hypothetical protein
MDTDKSHDDDDGATESDAGGGSGSGSTGGSGGSGGGDSSGGGDGSGGWNALCDGGPAIFDVSTGTATQVGTETAVGTLDSGELVFCAGHDYAVELEVFGPLILASSDGSPASTTLWPAGSGTGVDGDEIAALGLTFSGFSDTPLRASGALVLQDVVLSDNGGGGTSKPLLRCGTGGCALTDTLITRNDSGATGLIRVGPGSVAFNGVDIIDNAALEIIDGDNLDGLGLGITGGSIEDNLTSQATIDDSDCGGTTLSNVRASGNVSTREFPFLSCNCGGGVEMSDAEGTITASCFP